MTSSKKTDLCGQMLFGNRGNIACEECHCRSTEFWSAQIVRHLLELVSWPSCDEVEPLDGRHLATTEIVGGSHLREVRKGGKGFGWLRSCKCQQKVVVVLLVINFFHQGLKAVL